jgi:multidrug transporter EmrE-like cation transporter
MLYYGMQMFYILLAGYVITTSGGLISLKLGSAASSIVTFADGRLAIHPTLLNLLGVLLYGISFFVYAYLISKFDLGYIIPLTTALVYIVIFLASAVIFKEAFSIAKIGGIVLIVLGLILLNLKH